MSLPIDLKTVSIMERRAIFTKVAADIGIRVDMIEKDYAMMREMIYGQPPTWKELSDFISRLEEEIRTL